MRSYKTTLIFLTVLLAVVGTGYLAWLFFRQFRQPDASPYSAIPENASLVVRVNDPIEFWAELEHSNLMWKELQNMPAIHKLKTEILFIDSLTRTNRKIESLSSDYPLLIALVPMGRTTFGTLYITSVKGGITNSTLSGFLKDKFGDEISIVKTPYASSELLQVILKKEKKALYLAVSKGVFICSFQSTLIRKSMDQLVLNIPTFMTPGFQEVENTTGKKVEANIYLHYPYSSPLLIRILKPTNVQDLVCASNFAEWSGLDLRIKKDELLAYGYTFPGDSISEFIHLFEGQVPQKITAPSVIPDNAWSFTWIGLSDVNSYFHLLNLRCQQNNAFVYRAEKLRQLLDQNEIPLSGYFLPWIGNEMALVAYPDKSNSSGKETYALIRMADPKAADSLLRDLASSLGRKTDSILYNGQVIYNLRTGELLPALFNIFYESVKGSWYTYLNNFVIFGNDPSALKRYVDRVNAGMVLGKSSKFSDAYESIAENANYFFYYKNATAAFDFKNFLNENLMGQIEPYLDSLRKFETLSFQLVNNGSSYYTNILLNYNPELISEGPMTWQVALDSLVKGRPKIVRACVKGDPAILATDAGDKLYMIDGDGIIRWKIQLPGKPLGEIREIFLKNSDSSIFLFNTEEYICAVDGQGRYLPKYPLKLPRAATAGLTACLFRGSSVYNLLIPLDDDKVHIYTLPGKPSGRWLYPSPGEKIEKPVQLLTLHNKDFLFITGRTGKLIVTDSRGKVAIRIRDSFRVSLNSRIYINRTNKKGPFLASNSEGKINYIRETGPESEVTFNLFTPGHSFLYTDINLAGDYEYIFFDMNKLYYYDRFNKLIYSYSFPRKMNRPPYLFDLSGTERYIGIFSDATREIFLFGRNGLIATDPVIRGTTPFNVGHLASQGPLSLVIGSGRFLKNYVLLKE